MYIGSFRIASLSVRMTKVREHCFGKQQSCSCKKSQPLPMTKTREFRADVQQRNESKMHRSFRIASLSVRMTKVREHCFGKQQSCSMQKVTASQDDKSESAFVLMNSNVI